MSQYIFRDGYADTSAQSARTSIQSAGELYRVEKLNIVSALRWRIQKRHLPSGWRPGKAKESACLPKPQQMKKELTFELARTTQVKLRGDVYCDRCHDRRSGKNHPSRASLPSRLATRYRETENGFIAVWTIVCHTVSRGGCWFDICGR